MRIRFNAPGFSHYLRVGRGSGSRAQTGFLIWVAGILFFCATGVALADQVEDLLKMLQSKTPMDRREAAHELGRLKDPRAVSPLIAALKDEEPMVRLDVSGALIEIGKPVVDPLIEAVKHDNDPIFLWNAIRVLEEVGDPKAIEPLKEIEQKHPDPSIQQIAKYGLEKLQRAQKP